MILRKIDVSSCGKVLGTFYALMGLVFGAFFSLAALFGEDSGLISLASIILLPALYGLMGFFGGMIAAALYNFVASLVGGIELDIRPSRQNLKSDSLEI